MPVMTPEQLGEISVRFEKLTRDFEEKLLEDIARRIAKAGMITDTAEWQLIRLKEMGYANDFIKKALAEYTQKSEEEINWLFFDAGQCSDEFYSEVYAAVNKDFLPIDQNPEMMQYVEAGIAQTKGELHNYTRSMGFRVMQPNGTTAFKPVAKAYQDALDLAQMQVSMGVFDYNTAIRNATKTLCDSGLQFVNYETGHVNHADVAVRRAVLTGVSQLTGKISEHNAAELETDIVEVTAHAGARPDHAVWQGRWFSLSGKSKKYPSLVEVTGYGTGAGLKGWNCRHDFNPVIDGVSAHTYTEEELMNIDPPPLEYDGKLLSYYECTQRQRQIETAMRKTKRQIIAAKGSGDDDMFTAKSVLLRRQKEEYEKFSKAAGLLTQNERTQVYGFDRSTAAKSSWAARKAEAAKATVKTSKGSSSGSGGHAVAVNVPTPPTNGGKGKLYRDEGLTDGKNGDIIKAGGGKVSISAIEQPMERQHTGKGNPNAILTFDVSLNNRQQKILEKLPEFDSRVAVPKKSVNMADLSALTAKTGDEFAMFTKGTERLIIRGNSNMVNIDIEQAKEMSANGYKWSGHTHPGIDGNCLVPSLGDILILREFLQENGVIYNSKGSYQTFGKE